MQVNPQFHFPAPGIAIDWWVVQPIEFGRHTLAIFLRVTVHLLASLGPVKAHVRVTSDHAKVDASLSWLVKAGFVVSGR